MGKNNMDTPGWIEVEEKELKSNYLSAINAIAHKARELVKVNPSLAVQYLSSISELIERAHKDNLRLTVGNFMEIKAAALKVRAEIQNEINPPPTKK